MSYGYSEYDYDDQFDDDDDDDFDIDDFQEDDEDSLASSMHSQPVLSIVRDQQDDYHFVNDGDPIKKTAHVDVLASFSYDYNGIVQKSIGGGHGFGSSYHTIESSFDQMVDPSYVDNDTV